MAVKKKKIYKFVIGQEDYDLDDGCKPYKPVFLDGKEIFRLDQTRYMGIKKDQTNEVIEKLKQIIKKDINKDDLQRAIMLGVIEK